MLPRKPRRQLSDEQARFSRWWSWGAGVGIGLARMEGRRDAVRQMAVLRDEYILEN